ncbi:MAG: hypothetical protein ABSA75_10845 [Candidatus Bathyarchaeia archaeon]
MKNLIADKKTKPSIFQVLLLDNDSSEDVEVQEAKQVNFLQVKEHLKNGGSVFITSKNTQKIVYPKGKAQLNFSKSRKNYGALFRQHLRSP